MTAFLITDAGLTIDDVRERVDYFRNVRTDKIILAAVELAAVLHSAHERLAWRRHAYLFTEAIGPPCQPGCTTERKLSYLKFEFGGPQYG